MARIKTYAGSSTILPEELNAIQDSYDAHFASYRPVGNGHRAIPNSAGIGLATYFVGFAGHGPYGTAHAAAGAMYINPDDYRVEDRVAKFRLRANLLVNATAPGNIITIGLSKVTPSGSNPLIGIVTNPDWVAGSTIVFGRPPANSRYSLVTGDFAIPAAGLYAIGWSSDGYLATNSGLNASGQLMMRET